MPLVRFEIRSPLRHVAGMISLISIVVISAAVISWAFANTLARNSDTIQASEFAVGLSPSDPRARFEYASDLEKTFDLEAIPRSLSEYEKAASLVPHNYQYWVALGQARERAGERPAAEDAYRQALKLAPNYAVTKWALGNNLIRQAQLGEGLELIRGAVEQDPTFATPAVIAAIQVLNGDAGRVASALGSSPIAMAQLSKYLVNEGRFEEAAEVWGRLNADGKLTGLSEPGRAIQEKLVEANRFRDAARVRASLESDGAKRPAIGKVTNGGFESGVAAQNAELFDWRVGQTYPIYSLANSQSKEGRYSLLLRFPTPARLDFDPISQTIAVEPGVEYQFSLSYRSELNTRARFRWEVVTASTGDRIWISDPLSNSSEWNEISGSITVPKEVDGIKTRLVRENCDTVACTVSGNLWFDDIRLSRK